MPTLLDAAGLAIPSGIDGVSLLPAARGEADSVRPYLRGEHVFGPLSNHWIVESSMKYAWFSQSGKEQLFDLAADPTEATDFSLDPSYSEALTRLRGILIADLFARGDGYSDGDKLIVGNDPKAILPFMEKYDTTRG